MKLLSTSSSFVLIALFPLLTAFSPSNRTELKAAVNKWVVNRTEALITYGGAIGQWDVSKVDDMTGMFCGDDFYWGCDCGDLCEHFQAFDDDISGWDISKVTSMWDIFADAKAFNQNLSSWNTSSVTSMMGMFNGAISFNGSLSNFDTS